MAAQPKVKHIVTIGSNKYSLRASDIYGDLGGVTGVTKAPANDTTNYTDKITSADFSNGLVARVKARGVVLTNGVVTKSRDFTIIVTAEKLKSALAGLDSKKITIAGGQVYDLIGARIPQRRRFS
jgi:hypothetical protein